MGRGTNLAWDIGEGFMEEVTLIWVFLRNLIIATHLCKAKYSPRLVRKTEVNETKWVGNEGGVEDDESGADPALVSGRF